MPFNTNDVAASIKSTSSVRDLHIPLAWASVPAASWVYYDCTIEVMLDSGIVVHNRLPQVDRTADTLASCYIDDPKMDKIKVGGVNLKSQDQYTDIVQRMGHSRYWFNLKGQALRIGYQIPIPAIKTIGDVNAIPYDKNPQWAFNRIFPGGNYGGVILWHASWSLWYTTAVPPLSNTIPAADPSAHINATPPPPKEIQTPFVPAGIKDAAKAVTKGTAPTVTKATPPPTPAPFGRFK